MKIVSRLVPLPQVQGVSEVEVELGPGQELFKLHRHNGSFIELLIVEDPVDIVEVAIVELDEADVEAE